MTVKILGQTIANYNKSFYLASMTQQDINNRMADWQRGIKFPKNLFPSEFPEWLNAAIRHHSPAGLRIPVKEYFEIWDKTPEDFTYWDLGVVFHIMEIRTPLEMDMSISEYQNFMEAVEEMIRQWRLTVEPKQKELMAEYQTFVEAEQKRRNDEMTAAITEPDKGRVIPMGEA